jgi:hypothetical protein
MSDSFYSFSEPLNRGIDFYQADAADVTIDINSSVTLTVSSYQFRFTNITIASNSQLTSNAYKIAYAAANLAVDGATVVIATERQDGDVVISAEVLVETNITKIAYASASLSADSNSVASGTKILISSCVLSSDSSVSASMVKTSYSASQIAILSSMVSNGTRIAFAVANLSGQVNLTTAGKIFLATIRINILNNLDVRAEAIRFGANITADSSLIRALLMLDGKPLTNQTRTFDYSVTPLFVENINWAGDSSRYYKNNAANSSGKRTFNIKWSFIPNYSNKTVDYRESRNYLKTVSMDPDVHTLTIINQDENGITPYTEENVTVFVSTFSENLIRRDLVDDVYYFDCSMTLEEV